MYGLRIFLSALFFLLAFRPHVMLLHAQSLEESTDSYGGTESLPASTEAEDTLATTAGPEEKVTSVIQDEGSTTPTAAATSSTASSMSMDTPAGSLETEQATTTSHKLPSTREPYSVMMTTRAELVKTEPSTAMTAESTDPGFTTEHETTVVSDVITSMHPPSSAIHTSAPATVHESTKATETISPLISSTEKIVETTPSTIATTRNIITTPHLHPGGPVNNDVVTEDPEDSSTSTSVVSSTISETTAHSVEITGTEKKASGEDSSPNMLIIIIIVVAIICIGAAFCVVIFVRRKKKSRSQRFGHGYMNGRNQRSKKKKGEEDAWAGPVNLEGGDKAECDGPEELGQDDKNPDGTDVMLSTFVASEGNGGVGRPGSMEVQKWEEQEPLLYIDEDAKAEAKEKQNEGVEKAKDVGQKEGEDTSEKTEMKEAEKNGGEAFCLTTAV